MAANLVLTLKPTKINLFTKYQSLAYTNLVYFYKSGPVHIWSHPFGTHQYLKKGKHYNELH